MLKKEARKQYREKRQALSESQLAKWDDMLLIQFQQLILSGIDTLLSYAPIAENNEPAVHHIVDFCKFRNPALRVCYPQSDFTLNEMQALVVTEQTPFVKNKYGIYEPVSTEAIAPTEIDMIIIPLLAFDKKGYRVGYGKGFYDKYLTKCRIDCLKVGLSYFEPIAQIEDCHEFDVPLDIVVTPERIYEF